MLDKITPRYQALLLLIVWGAILLTSGLLRLDAYSIEESATRAMLLVWSVVDNVINPIFILGLPDLRALLFAPVGIYWPGSIIALKVFSAIICFIAIALFARHIQRDKKEAALISGGLLLIAPITLAQINSIGAGPYILLGFCLGLFLDKRYRQVQRPLGGWFFLQILLITIMTSIHPLALAYPIGLVIEWHKNPIDTRQQRHMVIGIAIAVTFALLMRGGWEEISWLANPLAALSAVIWTDPATFSSIDITSTIMALALAAIVLLNIKQLYADFLGRLLLLTTTIGLTCADTSWAFIGLVLLLYIGSQQLLILNSKMGSQNFLGQRGLAMLVLFFTTIIFMQGDKLIQQNIANNLLSPADTLIQTLALELEDVDNDKIRIISQWPGRTMLATRRPALPLPPDYPDSETLLANIKGITHIMFDPRASDNTNLGHHLSNLTAISETLAIEPGGVIIAIDTDPSASTGSPHNKAELTQTLPSSSISPSSKANP